MFSREIVTTKQMMQAILVGFGVGLVGVGCFVLLLVTANRSVDAPSATEEVIAVDAPVQASATFYAIQHGVYTTEDSAKSFMATYPLLNKALVVEVDNSFYVWSGLASAKRELSVEPTAFMKPMQIVSAGCEQSEIADIPNLLQNEQALNLKFDEQEKSEIPAQWNTVMTGLAPLSKDVEVLRLHSFAHFYEKESCLQVRFDL